MGISWHKVTSIINIVIILRSGFISIQNEAKTAHKKKGLLLGLESTFHIVCHSNDERVDSFVHLINIKKV